jgi:hypothetical protein
MVLKWQFNVLTALGVVALLLVVTNAALATMNRGTQVALNQKQLFIQQTVPLETLYQEMLKALAEMAVKSNDRQVLEMLAAQGLSVSVNNPVTGSNAAAPSKSEKQK